MGQVVIKRVYSEYQSSDGYRILVDRLWPRGIKKEDAHLDLWLKNIGPSNELRKWFGHEAEKWNVFQEKYKKELESNRDVTEELIEAVKKNQKVTLLFGARNEEQNQAVVLKEWLKDKV